MTRGGRWILVALISGVFAFGAMMLWLLSNVGETGEPWPAAKLLELSGVVLGAIFLAGRIGAWALISAAAAKEVEAAAL